MEKFTDASLFWIREPRQVVIEDDKIEIITEPFTDLWQRTYYGFQNDNAPVLQMKTDDPFFSFVVKTTFDSSHRFDQCGIVIYLDSENWLKASVEYENDDFQRLGSVVTNQGFSDWATTDISTDHREVWYRLSRRQSDYCIDYSFDGVLFKQMRICHLNQGDETISFGIYACSPENASFTASFEALKITDCKWAPHS